MKLAQSWPEEALAVAVEMQKSAREREEDRLDAEIVAIHRKSAILKVIQDPNELAAFKDAIEMQTYGLRDCVELLRTMNDRTRATLEKHK